MGGGASLESGLYYDSLNGRYFCHECNHIFLKSSEQESVCSYCHSAEIEEFRPTSINRQLNYTLSAEQSRRIANATVILRLLELQLRQELEQLQQALEAARSSEDESSKSQTLSPLMKVKLKYLPLDMDMFCSQPCCPICNEDFCMDETVLCMPCSHIFHNACVMPWLDMKQNCPVCRFQLDNTLPTIQELELHTNEELIKLLSDQNIVICDAENKSRFVKY